MSATAPGQQLTLFEIDPVPLHPVAPPPRADEAAETAAPPPPPCADPRQLDLFSAWPQLAGALGNALAAADFVAARQACEEIAASFGDDEVPGWGRALAGVAGDPWRAGELAPALAAWRAVAPQLDQHQGRRFRDAFFRRLLERHAPEAIVAAAPDLLVPVLASLVALHERGQARRLVRDALLAGRDDLGDSGDPALDDLRAEDLAPRWLASLGAIRHILPLTPPDPREREALAAGLDAPVPAPDDARALAFWDALRLAEFHSGLPERLLHAARRRLRQLHPDLHAAYMSGSGPYA